MKTRLAWILLLLVGVQAHKHHQHGPPDDTVPIDSILWIHMALQLAVWLGLFPLTMVLGLVRHRLHVPLAIVSLLLTTGGYVLGHSHRGRSFPHTAHGTFASLLIFYLGAQAALGIYLRLHLDKHLDRFYQRSSSHSRSPLHLIAKFERAWVRPSVLIVHGLLAKSFPLVGWIQCIFGVLTLRSWCFGGALGPCLLHGIAGSALIAYCILLLICLKRGTEWLQHKTVSPEFFESLFFVLLGIASAVNLLMRHHDRLRSISLDEGVLTLLWLFGGAAGCWLGRRGMHQKHSICFALVTVITGLAIGLHPQSSKLATTVNAVFGYTLMAAGFARAIEACLVAKDQNAPQGCIRRFHYVAPYLVSAAGVLFLSSTPEQLHWSGAQDIPSLAWISIDYAIALLIFFWSNLLIDLYLGFGGHEGQRKLTSSHRAEQHDLAAYERLELRESLEGGPRTPMTPAAPKPETPTSPVHADEQPPRYEPAEEEAHVLFAEEDEDRDPFDDTDDSAGRR